MIGKGQYRLLYDNEETEDKNIWSKNYFGNLFGEEEPA